MLRSILLVIKHPELFGSGDYKKTSMKSTCYWYGTYNAKKGYTSQGFNT
jgi:hypothetical protein